MNRFRSLSLRSQLIILILLMTLMPIGIICHTAFQQQERDIEEAYAIATAANRHIQTDQDILLAGAEQLAATISNLPIVHERNAPAVNALLAELIKTNQRITNIIILDKSGIRWASGIPVKDTNSYADRRYFKNAIATGKPASGEYTIGRITPIPLISFGYPIKDTSGTVTNVLAIVFSLDMYNRLYSGNIAAPTSAILITDHNGTILFHSVDPALVGKQDRPDLFRRMADGDPEGTFEAVGVLGVKRLYSYRKLAMKSEAMPYLYIRSGLDKSIVLKKARNDLFLSSGILLAAMLVLIGAAVYHCKRSVLDRVTTLLEATHRIAAGDLAARTPVISSQNELDSLGLAFNDMADRLQQAAHAQRESEEKYRELVENANSIILKWDNEGRVIYFNEYAEKFFGYTNEEIIGRSIIGTIVPETDSAGRDLAEMIRNICNTPEAFVNNENENIRKNGERIWVSWNNHALMSPDGLKAGILSVGQDITERKRIETELQKSEHRFRAYVENANDVVFALSSEGIFTYLSPKWKEAFGYEIEDTIGRPFAPYVHPDDIQGCFDFLNQVMTSGQQQSGVEYRVLCKDGTYRWYRANGALIKDPSTESLTFIGIGRDITERRQNEETLRQSEFKFSSVFHASPDAIILSRLADGMILDVNEGFTRMTGYAAQQVIGKLSELELWQDASDRNNLVSAARKHVDIKHFEARLKNFCGTMLLGQLSARIIEVDGAPCLLSIIRDITERDYILSELIKAQKLESISTLAGGIAHNFNNVITGVIGYLSYAKKHLDNQDKVLQILDAAEKSSYRAAGIARQLLTFSQAGPPVRKPVPVDALVRESVSLFLSGSNIRGEIECNSHQLVSVDSHQISQAFNNIVLNAVHAMPNGGILKVSVTSSTLYENNRYSLPPGNYVSIVFEDCGCGIKRDDLSKVFDPYFTTRDSGTGLGLSTTHSIIVKHNGHIYISSEAGKGTTVTILIPALTDEQAAKQGVTDASGPRAAIDSILVIDDEELIRDFTRDLLGGLGYKVVTCGSGEEAVRLYKEAMDAETAYSVVIVDIKIEGGIDGAETAQNILRIDPRACLIAVSGNPNEPALTDFRAFGFSSAISKPYRSSELLETLNEALKSRLV